MTAQQSNSRDFALDPRERSRACLPCAARRGRAHYALGRERAQCIMCRSVMKLALGREFDVVRKCLFGALHKGRAQSSIVSAPSRRVTAAFTTAEACVRAAAVANILAAVAVHVTIRVAVACATTWDLNRRKRFAFSGTHPLPATLGRTDVPRAVRAALSLICAGLASLCIERGRVRIVCKAPRACRVVVGAGGTCADGRAHGIVRTAASRTFCLLQAPSERVRMLRHCVGGAARELQRAPDRRPHRGDVARPGEGMCSTPKVAELMRDEISLQRGRCKPAHRRELALGGAHAANPSKSNRSARSFNCGIGA